QHVVRQRIGDGIDDVSAPLTDADGIAIGRGAREPADADIAARARDVLDHDRLAARGAQPPARGGGRSAARSGWERTRASASEGPPAGNGAIMVMGRDG